MSVALTVLVPFVSPARTFMLTAVSGRTCPKVSVTLYKVTAKCWTSATPIRFSVMALPLTVPLEMVPVPVVTPAIPLAMSLGKLITIVCTPPLERHSTPGAPLSGRGISKVPAAPCVLRETAAVGARERRVGEEESCPLVGRRCLG